MKKIYEKGSIGWLNEQQIIKAKKEGFDNIEDWKKWKTNPFNIIEKKYGKEFVDWAIQNKGNIPNKWLNAGCKTGAEYNNKCAIDAGFKNIYDRFGKDYRYVVGLRSPFELNENCPDWFGDFTEKLIIRYYPGAIKMPPKNPGFDFLWKDDNGKEVKIDNKSACLYYGKDKPTLNYGIRYNIVADIFIVSGWNNRDDLNPLIAWIFNRNDIIRRKPFWKRESLGITYEKEFLKEFEDYRIDINWLKELL